MFLLINYTKLWPDPERNIEDRFIDPHPYLSMIESDESSQVKTTQFLNSVVDLLIDFVAKSNDRLCKVLDFHHPTTLRDMISHCLDIPDQPQDLEQILSDCKETLKYCVKTGLCAPCSKLATSWYGIYVQPTCAFNGFRAAETLAPSLRWLSNSLIWASYI